MRKIPTITTQKDPKNTKPLVPIGRKININRKDRSSSQSKTLIISESLETLSTKQVRVEQIDPSFSLYTTKS